MPIRTPSSTPAANAAPRDSTGAMIASGSGARRRMARIPKGAEHVANPISKVPGFKIENVIVMAGVPSIMQAMMDDVAPKLVTGARMIYEVLDQPALEQHAAQRHSQRPGQHREGVGIGDAERRVGDVAALEVRRAAGHVRHAGRGQATRA